MKYIDLHRRDTIRLLLSHPRVMIKIMCQGLRAGRSEIVCVSFKRGLRVEVRKG